MGRTLILLGAVLVVAGFLVTIAGRWTGRVPGDIVMRRPNFTFYVPLGTSLLLSVLLSLALWLFGRR